MQHDGPVWLHGGQGKLDWSLLPVQALKDVVGPTVDIPAPGIVPPGIILTSHLRSALTLQSRSYARQRLRPQEKGKAAYKLPSLQAWHKPGTSRPSDRAVHMQT